MNLYALIIGILVALYIIIRLRQSGLERRQWVYPALLASFPVYYWVFAGMAADYRALVAELAIGLLFLGTALVAYWQRSRTGMLLLSAGYVAHAVYDGSHDLLFHNPGTPLWWPEFCGVIDLLIGAYIAWIALVRFAR